MPGYIIYSVSIIKTIKGEKDIISDDLSWVGIEFFVFGRVGQVFLNFTDVKCVLLLIFNFEQYLNKH